jgi:hypothetical protein
MSVFSPARLLAIWELGARRHPIDRALLLFSMAAPDVETEHLADAPLGTRNAAIMALRNASFGSQLKSWMDCPACGERMEFEIDPALLPAPAEPPASVEVSGVRFVLPTSRHLAEVTQTDDPDRAAVDLLRACLASDAHIPDEPDALAELIDAVGDVIETADPWADLSITLPCPACARETIASFDIADYFWDELDKHARGLLDDIHLLASHYGWTEPDILALSDTRRAAYLDRVNA